ncbi:MAG TPA: glycosyltransferase [Cyclobacteriaceae bacterium]|nr:glycosyltransferase [Cyclobacteriaceae bacterium]
MDIVFFAIARWDAAYSSPSFCLATEFAKKHRVFYIDNPVTWKYFISNYNTPEIRKRKKQLLGRKDIYTRLPATGGELIAVTPPMTIPVNFLPQGSSLYDRISRINDRILFPTLKKLIEDHNIKDFLFINSFNPFYLRSFPSYFKPKTYAYLTIDDISQSAHVNKHGVKLEEEMVSKAEVTFTTSRELRRLKLPFSKEVYVVPNAADVTLFKSALIPGLPRPKEIAEVTKPIIIYTGHLEHRTNFDLLKYVVKEHSDKVFLMVGPVTLEKELLAELQSFPNMIFAGSKNIKELPAYLQHSHCAIIPYKHNTLTRSIYPLKVNEYLAAGKPVVSTTFSDDIMDFQDVIKAVPDAPSFSKAITDSLAEDSLEKQKERVLFVENNTWETRTNEILRIVNQRK